ncbi:cytochrome c3 family protein, partial [bacterium]|nr:cytochrome c3 family protein [bacterium]
TGQPVEWVRVHMLPDYAFFDHSVHIAAGVACQSCHGRIDQMEKVTQAEPLSMSWCLDCHRNPEPNLRPKDKVTKMGWVPEADAAAGNSGLDEIAHRAVNPPVNCSGCHR